jgi:hypothetical protein
MFVLFVEVATRGNKQQKKKEEELQCVATTQGQRRRNRDKNNNNNKGSKGKAMERIELQSPSLGVQVFFQTFEVQARIEVHEA